MIRSFSITLALAFPLAGFCASTATAQEARPALRANVTVTGDIVRIGDLVDNAGAVAEVPIFRAPDLGTRGAVRRTGWSRRSGRTSLSVSIHADFPRWS
jgi:flagellar basal body P-ring formation protein FlgA